MKGTPADHANFVEHIRTAALLAISDQDIIELPFGIQEVLDLCNIALWYIPHSTSPEHPPSIQNPFQWPDNNPVQSTLPTRSDFFKDATTQVLVSRA